MGCFLGPTSSSSYSSFSSIGVGEAGRGEERGGLSEGNTGGAGSINSSNGNLSTWKVSRPAFGVPDRF